MKSALFAAVHAGCLIHDESASACGRTRRPAPSVCATIWYPRCAATLSAWPWSSPSVVHDSSSTITSEPNELITST